MYTVKRRFKRYGVEGLDIQAKTVFTTDIELTDISMTGACIKANEMLKVSGNYIIWFENEGILLPFKVAVIWQKMSGSQEKRDGKLVPEYTAGIEFLNSYSDKVSQLRDFIGRLKLSEEQRFAYEKNLRLARFKLPSRENAHLNYEAFYAVKKISLGGMLVKTDQAFKVDRNYPMELLLPHHKGPIKFRGRIASCIYPTGKARTHIDTGIEFLDITAYDRANLNTFIQRHLEEN